MNIRRFKLRFRRNVRKHKQQVEGIGVEAERQLENNFLRRLHRLGPVRRFVTIWLLVIILLGVGIVIQSRALSGYYQKLEPVPGGIYSEGILGAYTNANPVYASGGVNSAVSRLIFAGLLKYDNDNQLTGDLASDWQVDKTGEIYTVHLRPGVKWSDGQPVTAADVVFTYQVIQNPDADSPMTASWQNVTVAATDDHTVVFTLPNPLSSFPYSLTTGIISKHILGNVPMDQMRSVAFNTTAPVGAGPFMFESVQVDSDVSGKQQQAIELKASPNYHWGKPKLDRIIIHTFDDEKQMVHSFKNQEINAMAGLSSVPDTMVHDNAIHKYDIPLTAETDVFFRNTNPILTDAKVRQALVSGTDTATVIKNAGFITAPVNEPLLKDQLGYDPSYRQAPFNPSQAMTALDKDNWIVGANGYRYNKSGQQLEFGLYAPNTDEYARIAHQIEQQWKNIGVKADLHLQDSSDFNATLAYHSYDALLYSISIGVDPDVFVYWDSTQADVRSPTRLNFSEYRSATADAALEAGRTRTDPQLRAIKYQPFLKAWQQDAPAVGLYQPRFLYITHTKVYGFDTNPVNTDADRFNNVQDWEINEAPQTIKSQ